MRKLAWTLVLAAAIVVLWRASDLLLLGFGSVLGAVMFRSAARLFARAGVQNAKIALGLGMIGVLAVIGAMAYLLVVQFGSEIAAILGNLPGTIDRIEENLSTTKMGAALVDATRSATSGGVLAERLGGLLTGGGKLLVNLLIVIVGAMFIAGNPAPYRRAIVQMTPPSGRAAIDRGIDQITASLRLWLKAKMISMVVMAVLISGGLWWAGMKSWAAMGLLGGLSEFVPYVGPAVAMVPAIGLAATASADLMWRVIIAYSFIRLFEAYALTPFLTKKVVNIPPALTLFTILGVGAVFGIYGVFFAGALLVVAFVGVREFYLRDTLGEDIDGLPEKAAE